MIGCNKTDVRSVCANVLYFSMNTYSITICDTARLNDNQGPEFEALKDIIESLYIQCEQLDASPAYIVDFTRNNNIAT